MLAWITDSHYKKQLPALYRFFASYCGLYIALLPGEKIVGAEFLLRSSIAVQRIFSSLDSWRIDFDDIVIYLDMTDPRFLAVGREIIKGDIGRMLPLYIREGDTFVDVGANQGAYSVIASTCCGASGLVVSVEPQPRLSKNIKRSLESANNGKFEVHQIAVGSSDGMIDLIVPRSYSGTAGVYPEQSAIGRHRILKVPLRRFDEAFDWKSFPGSIFIKLDIEGSEYAFLQGAEKMIRARRPLILMEINIHSMRASNTDEMDLLALLKELGYTHYRFPEDDETLHPIDSLGFDEVRDVLFSR